MTNKDCSTIWSHILGEKEGKDTCGRRSGIQQIAKISQKIYSSPWCHKIVTAASKNSKMGAKPSNQNVMSSVSS
uniref:Uncharacterized protein n=1 Tax=Romanomermis culicivorax TaxID=13658 RepID=A0A915IV34_ROMCU